MRTSRAAAAEEVRREVARELHDRVAQTLTTMLLDLENFKSEEVAWDGVLDQLNTIQSSTRQVLQSLRQLLLELRGGSSDRAPLVDSVESLLDRFSQRTGIVTELTVDPEWPRTFSEPAALNVYRIIEQALTNVQRHSGARTVRVAMEAGDEQLSVTIADDGHGFQDDSAWVGLGTMGMRERAVLLGGNVQVVSTIDGGTTVLVTLPRNGANPLPQVEPKALAQAVVSRAPEREPASVSA